MPAPRDTVELMAFATNRLGRTVLELEDATVSVAGRTLLAGVTWRLGPGDRVGIVGINGSGKTTLLRALSGERALDSGKRVQGSTVKMAQLSRSSSICPPRCACWRPPRPSPSTCGSASRR